MSCLALQMIRPTRLRHLLGEPRRRPTHRTDRFLRISPETQTAGPEGPAARVLKIGSDELEFVTSTELDAPCRRIDRDAVVIIWVEARDDVATLIVHSAIGNVNKTVETAA